MPPAQEWSESVEHKGDQLCNGSSQWVPSPCWGSFPGLLSARVRRKLEVVRGDVKVSLLWTFRPFSPHVQSCWPCREASGHSESWQGEVSRLLWTGELGAGGESCCYQAWPSVSHHRGARPRSGADWPGTEQGSQLHRQPGDHSSSHWLLPLLPPASQLLGTTLGECSRA